MASVLIGVGANLGDRAENIRAAAKALGQLPEVSRLQLSGLSATGAIGGPVGQPEFLNAAIRLETFLSPEALLAACQEIERAIGRTPAERWGPRAVDLDLLLFGDVVRDSPVLVLPHPRMAFRRFVLTPAAEIAGELMHPGIGWTVAQLLAHLNETPCYAAAAGLPAEMLARLGGYHLSAGRLISPDAKLAGCSSLLDRLAGYLDPKCWPGSVWPVVSDFWYDELPLRMAGRLGEVERREYDHRHASLRSQVARARLVILCEPALAASDAADAPGTYQSQFNMIRQRALSPGVGPVLILAPEQIPLELPAALEAMR